MKHLLRLPALPWLMGLLLLLCSIAVSAQTVSNVRAEQEGSDIIIQYDLEAKEPCGIEVYVSPDGGRSWQGPLSNLSGDVGKNISAGAKKCRWAVLKAQDQFKGADVKFKVVVYRTITDLPSIKIGRNIWSATNLNVLLFANGDSIPEAKTDQEWIRFCNEGQPAWSYCRNNSKDSINGKLYNWYAVADPRGLCP